MVAWPHLDFFSFAIDGDSSVVVRSLLLHGGYGDLLSGQLVRTILVLSLLSAITWMGLLLSRDAGLCLLIRLGLLFSYAVAASMMVVELQEQLLA
jgi:hypothetical protein